MGLKKYYKRAKKKLMPDAATQRKKLKASISKEKEKLEIGKLKQKRKRLKQKNASGITKVIAKGAKKFLNQAGKGGGSKNTSMFRNDSSADIFSDFGSSKTPNMFTSQKKTDLRFADKKEDFELRF